MKVLLYLALCLQAVVFATEAQENLKPFPPAAAGQARHVIFLPERANEGDFKVELLVGRIVVTDAVNQKMMGGAFVDKNLQGWGFTYYEATLDRVATTLMMPPPGSPQVERFVHMQGKLVRYNSRLPIVIYTPEDAEVRYRIWSAGETQVAEVDRPGTSS
jgi:ecotin